MYPATSDTERGRLRQKKGLFTATETSYINLQILIPANPNFFILSLQWLN